LAALQPKAPPLGLVPVGFKGEHPFTSSACAVGEAAAIQF
jgi:hypothetical protein